MKIITIGRSPNNDVNVDDPKVSRTHCQILQDDYGNFRLIDTNSSNGTYINGIQRHGEVKLNKTDIIRIGNTTLPWQSYFNGSTTGMGGRTEVGTRGGYYQQMPSTPPSPPTKPDNFLVWSILGMLFCCLPFGIVSVVQACKVDQFWLNGNYAEAENAARKARTWFWWSFGTGLVICVLYILFYVIIGITLF